MLQINILARDTQDRILTRLTRWGVCLQTNIGSVRCSGKIQKMIKVAFISHGIAASAAPLGRRTEHSSERQLQHYANVDTVHRYKYIPHAMGERCKRYKGTEPPGKQAESFMRAQNAKYAPGE